MVKTKTCPICNKPLPPDAVKKSRYFPFCSEQCKWVDLYRWLDGKYAIVEPLSAEELFELKEQMNSDTFGNTGFETELEAELEDE